MQSELAKYLPLQNDTIHYHGQPIALVIAENSEAANHAITLIYATYAESPAHVDFEANLHKAQPEKK